MSFGSERGILAAAIVLGAVFGPGSASAGQQPGTQDSAPHKPSVWTLIARDAPARPGVVAADKHGFAYVAGQTNSQGLATTGAFQRAYGGGQIDAFVAKLSPMGRVIYFTYLGGSDSDFVTGISIDATGEAVVSGGTYSKDFPIDTKFENGRLPAGSPSGFVAKLNRSGTKLIFSSYLPGIQPGLLQATVDGAGNVHVAGVAESKVFPSANTLTLRPGNECFSHPCLDTYLLELDAAGRILRSTYIRAAHGVAGLASDRSGSAYILATPWVVKVSPSQLHILYASTVAGRYSSTTYDGLAVDGKGNAYVTGATDNWTTSTSRDAIQRRFGGEIDAYLAKFNGRGRRTYFSFLGGSRIDQGFGVSVGPHNSVYLTGMTNSSDFRIFRPVQSRLGSATCPDTEERRPCYQGFVTKLNGSRLAYSTYLGKVGADDSGWAISAGPGGSAFVAGTFGLVRIR